MSSSWKKLEKFRIPLEEIIQATDNFSSKNRIGDGGFGTVYKGQLSEKRGNRVVAFKRLDPQSYQGSDEFYNEVTIVSSFNHLNIISFIGYCDEANNMIIVYEYARNGSLDFHLAHPDVKRSLTWARRLEICLGAATGLMYLHSHLQNRKTVIHRDVKSANILLDGNMKAKICDFGLSRFGPKDPTDTQLITRPAGTSFYMDPVFTETRQISGKTDVYSFGVVLFEMLRGTLVYSELLVEDDKKEYLIHLVRRVYDNHPKKLIDPSLSGDIDENSFNIFKAIAYECIKYDVSERPSMTMVMQKLELAVVLHKENNSAVVTTEAVEKFLQIHEIYPKLLPYKDQIEYRMNTFSKQKMLIEEHEGFLKEFAQGYLKFGFNREEGGIVYREWAPAAAEAYLFGDFNEWKRSNHKMERHMFGVWTIKIPDVNGVSGIRHNTKVKFTFKHHHNGDWIDRVPAWINFTTSAAHLALDGVYRDPRESERYKFKNDRPSKPKAPHIYTVHFGMSRSSEPRVKSYREFADNILPRVKDNKYNTVLLMGVMEHSHYGSFGYYVTNFFAVSSISGTPEDLKYLIDEAHGFGLHVLMDVVHSHVSSNDVYGLYGFHVGQATQDSYFQNSCHGDSRFFNYSNWEVLRFLLSNLRWWLEEFMFDGFRFHGITSMLYHHHGIKFAFTGKYNEYFGESINVDAIVYMMLANFLIHQLLPGATVIADDISGMPGLCVPMEEGGIGFDFG